MKETLLKTKIIPPRIPKYTLYRDRLLTHLNSNLDKRLISICADAGYGKTTLLAQFVKKLENPYIWYQVDKSDQDFNLFIRYIIEGLKMYIPEFGKRTSGVISHSRGREIKFEILVGTFINELLECSKERILLVFDDLQEIYKSKKVIAGFKYLLHHIPANVSIIVSARSDLPFSVERFHFKNETFDIDQQDLKFNRDEIKMLCKQVSGHLPKQVELEQLEADSEGWITYLQFLVQPSKQKPVFAKSKKSLLNRLYGYYDKEVFTSLEKELKIFLVATSVFDHFSSEYCDFLLSKTGSKQILENLNKRHLFISVYDTPQPQYIYHHLFRNFLAKKLKETGLYQKFQNRAGAYLEKKGVFSLAVQHYYEIKNYQSIARLLEKFGEEYVILGRAEFIKPFMECIPRTLINNNPTLTRIQGRIYAWNCDWVGARACYLRAKQIAQRQRNHYEIFKSIHAQLQLKLDLGKHKGIASQTRKILRSKKLRSRKLRAAFLNHLAIALTFERKIKQSIPVYKEVLKILKRIGDIYRIDKILHNIAVSNLEMGNFTRAQNYFETIINKLRSDPSPTLILALNNLGHALTLQGSFTEVEEVLKEAMKYARLFNDKSKLCASYECLGVVKILEGELEQAERLLKKTEKMALEINNNWLLSNIWDGVAVLAINQGDFLKAKKYSDKALNLPIPSLYKTSTLLTKATVELSLRNLDVAKRALNQTLPGLKESKHLLMSYYFQMARFYLFKKDEVKAKNFIYKSIKLAEKNSYDFLLLYELKHCPEIIRFIKKINLRSSYFQHILLKLPYAETADILVEPEVGNYDFIVRLFDRVQILKAGKEIKIGSWRTKRFQELFCFFIANPGRGIVREKIIHTFWPDHKPAIAKQLFYNALYCVRKIAAKNIIVFNKESYVLSSKYRYWIDTEEFEKLTHKGDRLVRDGNRTAGLIKYEEAASLYRGGFMDDFYSEWCEEKRRYLVENYLGILRKLSSGHYKIGNFEKALKFCNLLISKDRYDEEAYCLTMRCYTALNDLRGIQNCFSNLKNILAEELKTTPRIETLRLFKILIKQRKI